MYRCGVKLKLDRTPPSTHSSALPPWSLVPRPAQTHSPALPPSPSPLPKPIFLSCDPPPETHPPSHTQGHSIPPTPISLPFAPLPSLTPLLYSVPFAHKGTPHSPYTHLAPLPSPPLPHTCAILSPLHLLRDTGLMRLTPWGLPPPHMKLTCSSSSSSNQASYNTTITITVTTHAQLGVSLVCACLFALHTQVLKINTARGDPSVKP